MTAADAVAAEGTVHTDRDGGTACAGHHTGFVGAVPEWAAVSGGGSRPV